MKLKKITSEVKENNAKTGNNEMKSILLANKKDLNDENRKISFEQGEALSKEYNFYLFKEITCKTQTEEEFYFSLWVIVSLLSTFIVSLQIVLFQHLSVPRPGDLFSVRGVQ